MLPSLMFDLAIRVTVLLSAAAALTWLLRRRSAAARHLVWSLAIAGALALPLLSLAGAPWEIGVLPPAEPAARPVTLAIDASHAVAVDMPGDATRLALAGGDADMPVAPSGEMSRAARDPWSWALLLWAAGVVAVMAHLALGTWRLRWLARRARPADAAGGWLGLAHRLCGALGIRARVVFLEGGPAAMPMTWGLWTARVLLPASASAWPAARRRVVLLHELAHVKRRDCMTQLLAQLACAVYWFNPLVWMAARRLRVERERACDDLVLAAGTRGSDYADHLLEIARSLRSNAMPTWAAVAMAHRSQLEGRLMAILDPEIPRRSPTRRLSMLVSAIGMLCVAPIALVTPVPRATADASAGPPVVQAAPTPVPAATPAVAAQAGPARQTPSVRPGLARIAEEAVRDALPDAAADLRAEGWIGEGLERVIQASAPAVAQAVGQAVGEGAAVLAGETPSKTAADPRIVTALVEALKDTDADVRDHALQALARVRAPEALGAIRGALADSRASVREQAAFALGQYRDASSLEALAGALKDTNAGVREQAAFALGEIRDRRAVDPLVAALEDEHPSVREQAAFALGRLRDPRAVGPLGTALTDASGDVREQAAFALGQIRDRAAVDPLIGALKDESASVREQAAFALGQLRDPRAIDALTAALKDASPDVREQAAFALGQLAR